MPRRARCALFVLAVVVIALPAAAAAKQPIKIGVEGPFSGSQSSNGLDILRGARLAARQANAGVGVLGRRIKIVRADDKGDRANAMRAARKVVRSGAIAVIGPYNSSVGLVNLPIYLQNRVVPVHLTSTDDTKGQGVTIQPKNSQIAPVEESYVRSTNARKVTMLVDDTPNGAFTIGMADRLQQRLSADGVAVTRISVKEVGDAGVDASYYATKVMEALATGPDLVYVSTYFPEGVKIGQALLAAGSSPRCLMGLANVDPLFVSSAGQAASQRCVYSGVPAAPQLPSAKRFVRQYRRAFHRKPGVWGVFAYDSMRILFRAIERSGGTGFAPVQRRLKHTRGYRGQTGTVTVDPATGYRTRLPFLRILRVDAGGNFVIAR